MNNIQMVHAYKALGSLLEQDMSLKNSYKLMKLQRRLAPLFDLYSEAELKLIEGLGLMNKMEGSLIHFGDADKEISQKYAEQHRELDEIQSDFNPDWKVHLDPDNRIRITPRNMALLSEMVDFGIEDDGNE